MYSVVINWGWNNDVAVKIVACWNWNVFTSSPWLDWHCEFVFTIHHVRRDPSHIIITVLSDRPSFEWECNVTVRPIWFCSLKLTFSTCFRVVVAQHGMDTMLTGALAKGRWAVLGMVNEGLLVRLSSSDITFLRKLQGLVKRPSYLYCGLTVLKRIW